MKKKDDLLVLRHKNVSNKTITAYEFDLGHGVRSSRDYIPYDDGVGSGDVIEDVLPLGNFDPPYPPVPSASDKPVLTILAVVFDDRSSEGDYNAAAYILNHRLGQKIQLKRIRQLIRDGLKSKDQEFSAPFYALKSQIESLPTEGQSVALRSGLNYAKERLLRHINEVEQWRYGGESLLSHGIHDSTSLRDALTKLKRMCEEQIVKL
jgi:hypothetical protein